MKVAVLGSSGFLGHAMTRHLAEAGHDVVSYCRRPTQLSLEYANITSITADLRDTWTLADAIKDVDVVYHFASATHPSLFFSNLDQLQTGRERSGRESRTRQSLSAYVDSASAILAFGGFDLRVFDVVFPIGLDSPDQFFCVGIAGVNV